MSSTPLLKLPIIPPQVDRCRYRYVRRNTRRFLHTRHLSPGSPSHQRKRSYHQFALRSGDIQICCHSDSTYGSTDVYITNSHGTFKVSSRLIDEKEQEKNRKPPKPGKPKPEQPEPPERKDDKGSRRVKRPKVKGSVRSIL